MNGYQSSGAITRTLSDPNSKALWSIREDREGSPLSSFLGSPTGVLSSKLYLSRHGTHQSVGKSVNSTSSERGLLCPVSAEQ